MFIGYLFFSLATVCYSFD